MVQIISNEQTSDTYVFNDNKEKIDLEEYVRSQIPVQPEIDFDTIYPVGSYYMTTDITFNPNRSFSGIWTPYTHKIIGDYNESETNQYVYIWRRSKPEAYVVYDSAYSWDGSSTCKALIFFRDDAGKYTDGQVIGTKTYYTGIESRSFTGEFDVPWHNYSNKIEYIYFEDTIQPVSTSNWFYNCNKVDNIELYLLDTSKVTRMHHMFDHCSDITELDVSTFDTSSVEDMSSMFSTCRSLEYISGIERFDTSSVTHMDNMFYYCQDLNIIDLTHFDTSTVTLMRNMFYYCLSLSTDITIMNDGLFDGSIANSFSGMFDHASTATGIVGTKVYYIDPVTSSNIDTLVATKSSNSNVVNAGEGVFIPPDRPLTYWEAIQRGQK